VQELAPRRRCGERHRRPRLTIPDVQATPELRRFADDEMLRAPMLIEQVIDRTLEGLGRATVSASGRAAASQLAQVLLVKRALVVQRFVASLREHVDAELAGRPRPAAAKRADGALALLDEEEVAADVEVSHAVEAIRSIAEHELLDVQTYTAALAGDMEVARDHNPFRPDICARALWDAAQALPVARGQHIAFIRYASTPIAQVLRRSYASACSRLESQGVEPAAYRTVIMPDGARRQRPGDSGMFAPKLNQLGIPLSAMPGSAPAGEIMQLHQAGTQRLAKATAGQDQMLLELIGRLFDAVVASSSVAADVRLLISRMQAPAVRAALADPRTLDDYSHPVWRFVDELAHLTHTLPAAGQPERSRHLRLAEGLVERLIDERQPGAEAFAWGLERLRAMQAHRLEQRRAAAADEIASLATLERRLADLEAPPTTLHGALDLGQLDTVPAPLMSAEDSAGSGPMEDGPENWLDALEPGHWIQAYLQGRRVNAMLLWVGERRDLWLLADAASDDTWAMRRRALLTLRGERLAGTLRVRSQVRRAAHRLLKHFGPGKPR